MHTGGFAHIDDKEMALKLLQSLCEHGIRRRHTFDVLIDDDWKMDWPRPISDPDPQHKISVTILEGGLVDFSAMHARIQKCAAEDKFDDHDTKLDIWYQWIEPRLLPGCKAAMWAQSYNCYYPMHGRGMWTQIFFQAAKLIEASLMLSAKSSDCSWPIRVKPGQDNVHEDTCREIDAQCSQHILQTRVQCRKMLNIGFAMDKANIKGLELSNGFAVLPSNVKFEFMPQVAHTYTHTDMQTTRQTARQAGRQPDRHTHKYILTHIHTYTDALLSGLFPPMCWLRVGP